MGQAKRDRPPVWVTGAEGLLGKSLVSWLKQEGIPYLATPSEVDVTSGGSLDHFLGSLSCTPSLVWNCAAMTGLERCEKNSERAFEINGLAPGNLGALGNKYGFRVIHVSSDAVFEGAKGWRAETAFPCPISVYARSKHEGERRLLNTQPQALVVRSSWLFGHHRLNFILRVLHAMSTQKVLHIAAQEQGRPTSVFDLIRNTWELREETGIWHLANRGSATWFDLAQEVLRLARVMGLPIVCEEVLPVTCQAPTHTAPLAQGGLLDTEKAERQGLCLRPWQEALHEVLELICSPFDPASLNSASL